MHGIDGGVCSHVLILGSCNKYGDRPNRVFSIELGRMYGAMCGLPQNYGIAQV